MTKPASSIAGAFANASIDGAASAAATTANTFADNVPLQKRVIIVAVDGFEGSVVAHYNPKEIQIDKQVPWHPHKGVNTNESFLEFKGAESPTVSLELFLDCFETEATLAHELETLTRMSVARQDAAIAAERRPPLLKIKNGPFPDLLCVLENLSIKITMMNHENQPVRAIVNLKLKQVKQRDGRLWSRS